MRKFLLAFLFAGYTMLTTAQTRFQVASPDGALKVLLETRNGWEISLEVDGKPVLAASPLSMVLETGQIPAVGSRPGRSHVNTPAAATVKPLYGQASVYTDHFHSLRLEYKAGYDLEIRAYNEGIAWRVATRLPGTIRVLSEQVQLRWADNYHVRASLTPQNNFVHSYEALYTMRTLDAFPAEARAVLPLLVEGSGIVAAFTETNLRDYPGMYLYRSGGDPRALHADFPRKVVRDEPGGWQNFHKEVLERAPWLAETNGARVFPWRILGIARRDADLLENRLSWLLADAPAAGLDFSWVRPGKVAWDWWNDWQLTGVPFRAGINTETYKYFVDFAAANAIEYINLDEGWSEQFDLLQTKRGVDAGEIIRYARSKGVGVFLWCVARTLDAQMEAAMRKFADWGAAGLKVDFMDRDDQDMVNFYWRAAEAAYRHKLLLNFHGAHKPAGLDRTWPHVINFEGVRGLEYNKFDPEGAPPDHAVTIPFARMWAGPMDYTPGATRNVQAPEFRVSNGMPVSMGTRACQLAMYVVYYMPLAMLSDAPTAYEKEADMLDFLRKTPTTWDETRALDGKIGQHVMVARRKGDLWFVGGLTNWDSRTLTLDLSFLPEGTFTAEIWQDGPNASRNGTDYSRQKRIVSASDKIPILLAPGGGFAAILTPLPQ